MARVAQADLDALPGWSSDPVEGADLSSCGGVNLRHFYASLLIRHGESVKTVQARLGHANAAETLDTYAHLWPDSEDRTRRAVDDVLMGRREASAAQ